MSDKKALITGITGQDGSYLADLLLEKDYEVHGIVRRSSSMENRKYIDDLDVILHYGDMTDGSSLDRILHEVKPDEIYNLAAMSHVGVSFKIPEYTTDVNALGVIRLLEAARKFCPKAKIYQASTSEMYGTLYKQADESSPFSTNSPYAASKLFAHNICDMYRQAYGMFICCGILFNHESPRRGLNFVTRKITKSLCRIKKRQIYELFLGNLNAVRDWGFAGDYVEAMWMMLQHSKPDDYVIATGKTHSVKEFVEEACKCLGVEISWTNTSLKELGVISWDGILAGGLVRVSEEYYRPKDVHYLKGNPEKAMKVLGWKPKTTFKQLVKMMIESDLK